MPQPRREAATLVSNLQQREIVDQLPEQVRQLLDTEDPAIYAISLTLVRTAAAGLDITDPAVLERAIAAGQRHYAAADQPPTKPATTGRGPAASVVYFMRVGNRVKIGYTTNLRLRRATLMPEELMATESGGPAREAELHTQFAAYRTSGEWFRLEGELADYIDQLRGLRRGRRPAG